LASNDGDERASLKRQRATLAAARRLQTLLLVKDVADVHYAASTAELAGIRNAGLNRGAVALSGLFSSVVGIQTNWPA
jgi:hypothetical protein